MLVYVVGVAMVLPLLVFGSGGGDGGGGGGGGCYSGDVVAFGDGDGCCWC